MKRGRFSEEQIIGILKEAEAGIGLAELTRKYGVSEGTVYRWKARFGGLEVNEARRLKRLEEENRRLKHIVADLTLDNQVLKAVIAKTSRAQGEAGSDRVRDRALWAEREKGMRGHRADEDEFRIPGAREGR
jgi:putative transposase